MEGRSSVIFKIADNGIIKEVTDYNVNGTADSDEYTFVYEFKDGKEKETTIQLMGDLIDDLGLPTGSKFEKEVVTLGIEPGSHFNPDAEWIESKISELEQELIYYKNLLTKLNSED